MEKGFFMYMLQLRSELSGGELVYSKSEAKKGQKAGVKDDNRKANPIAG